MPAEPVRYRPDVETLEPDEAATGEEITKTLLDISRLTYRDGGKALRSVHAKSHGLLRGELEIEETLPPEFKQGLFAQGGHYPVVMRFSTIPGDILDDNVSLPRGLAVKVRNVAGEHLDGSAGDGDQDFVLVNSPAFATPTAKAFLGSLKLLARTTDRNEGLKKVLSSALRGLERVVEAAGTQSGMLKAFGGHPRTNILGETFFSQAPLRFGDHIAKISVAPASHELLELKDVALNPHARDMIRDAVSRFFQHNSAVWEVRAQLCMDLATMPVEDSSKVWSEEASPFVTVGHLTVNPQDAWSQEKVREIDDCMSFSPWHGLRAHQPLGSIMRVRRKAYLASAEFRQSHNGCPMAMRWASTDTEAARV